MRLLLFAAVLALACPVRAATFQSLSVDEHDGIYEIHADIRLAAPPGDVRYVITDFNHLTRITGAIRESRLLAHPAPERWQVYTRTKACVLIFCRNIKEVQEVHETPDGTIVVEAVPDESNVRSSITTWRVSPEPGGTRLRWHMAIRPEFWVPPLIGPIMLRHALREEGAATARGIEKLALERAHRLRHPLPR